MVGFIAWQTGFGFFVVGFIAGWGCSILLASWLVRRRNRKDK